MIPGSGRLVGIQVDNNYISLPGELFEHLNESGINERYTLTNKIMKSLFRVCGILLF